MTSTADDAATFTYDRTDQLKSATYDKPAYADLTFSYDANGNRTGGGNTPGPDNRQASDGVSDFAYDLDGNMTRRTNKTTGAVVEYAWDLRNRLTDVTFKSSATGPATKKVHYTYDALNRRIGKSVDTDGNGTLDQVDWYANRGLRTDRENAGDEVMLRLGASGNVTGRYLHGASVDEILAEENIASDGKREVLWPLADQQGSVRDIVRLGTNGQATVVDHIMYGPYGEKVAETDTAIAHLYGYTGREYDKETGLQYNRARYYDPKLGRWISQDPIGFGGGDANLYRYVGNSPTNATDPSGFFQEPEALDLRMFWEPPQQSWSQWWDNDSAYRDSIKGVVDDLALLSGNDPYTLQMLMLEGGKQSARSRYARLLGNALIARQVSLLAAQQGCSNETAYEELFKRSREITGSYNYGTEMRIAAAHGSESGPIVAGIVLGSMLPGGVPRVGKPKEGTTEIPVENLTHTHPVPRPGKSINDTADKLRGGYDVSQPIPVIRMGDGKLILAGGNHRLAAMKQLNEKTIPCKVTDWNSLSDRIKEYYRKNFPNVFGGY